MPDNTCNGYTNWDTFIVCLYSDNEQHLYDLKQDMFKRSSNHDEITAARARHFADRNGLTGFCQDAEEKFSPSNVDWTDVADTWSTEFEEFKQYNA